MCIGTVATMHAPCVHSALSCKHHSSSQLLAEQANPVSSGPATVDHKVRAGIRNTQVASQIHRLQTCAPHMACSTVMSVQITLSTALAGLTGQITWHHQNPSRKRVMQHRQTHTTITRHCQSHTPEQSHHMAPTKPRQQPDHMVPPQPTVSVRSHGTAITAARSHPCQVRSHAMPMEAPHMAPATP